MRFLAPSASPGRPWVDPEGQAVVAELRVDAASGHWSRPEGSSLRPETDDLSAQLRAELAEAWAVDGLFEHSSVASFARFSIELLALGAPPELVTGAHSAALDEIRHARVCFELASCYAGREVGPGPLPVTHIGVERRSLVELARACVHEGCVAETLAAVEAEERHGLASDPAVREALALIAVDERSHSELAWATVTWAIEQDPPLVLPAVVEAFRQASVALNTPSARAAAYGSIHTAHGRLDAARALVVLRFALEHVVRPRAATLLGVR